MHVFLCLWARSVVKKSRKGLFSQMSEFLISVEPKSADANWNAIKSTTNLTDKAKYFTNQLQLTKQRKWVWYVCVCEWLAYTLETAIYVGVQQVINGILIGNVNLHKVIKLVLWALTLNSFTTRFDWLSYIPNICSVYRILIADKTNKLKRVFL